MQKIMLQWFPTIIILGYVIFHLLNHFFGVQSLSTSCLLIDMLFLLIVLPLLFLIQGMYSLYFTGTSTKNYFISMGTWILSSFTIAPDATGIYLLIYSLCFWFGALLSWLFKCTYRETPEIMSD